jgi:hypothetical protein
MDNLKLKALAALRWGWERLVSALAAVWAKLVEIGNTVYDPSPRTIKTFFFAALGIFAVCWATFAFVNSWFYKPTVQYFASFSWSDDGDVELSERVEVLPSVPTPATPVPSPAVVCQETSDTPHCEPVHVPSEKNTDGRQIEAKANSMPPPVAKPTLTRNKMKRVRKRQPFETYWGF